MAPIINHQDDRAGGATVAALPMPIIPAAHEQGGIGWHMLEDEQRPVIVQVLAIHFNTGDQVDLYWNNTRVGAVTVSSALLEAARASAIDDMVYLAFSVLPSLMPDGKGRVWYRVTDGIGGQTDDSEELSVTVKRLIPGGHDPDPSDSINQNLRPPGNIPEYIDASSVGTGINVLIPTYENRAQGDTISLSWHGQMLSQAVPNGANAFNISVDRATIERAGDTEQLVVRYEIRDEVNNWSKWSPSAGGVVDLVGQALVAPEVVEAGANDELDFDALNGRDVSVRVGPYEGMRVGHIILLTWSGETAAGEALEPIHLTHAVVAGDLAGGAVLSVSNTEVATVLQGQVRLSYRVIAGTDLFESRRKSIRVVGQLALAMPSIVESDGVVLDPSDVPDHGATVLIRAYRSMAEGDVLLVEWVGTSTAGDISYHQNTITISKPQVGQSIIFSVAKSLVQLIAGGVLRLYYTVTAQGGVSSVSPTLILSIVDGVPLPKPVIRDAVGDVLDPADAPNGTTVTVLKAALLAGDALKLFWTGPLANIGSDSYEEQRTITGSGAQQDQVFTIAPQYVIANIDKSVEVRYRIENRSKDSETVTLQVRGSSTQLPAPSVIEAPNGALDPIQANAGARVRVAYSGMLASDQIQVVWQGTSGAGTPVISPVLGSTAGFVEVNVPATAVGANIGDKTVTISYTRTRAGTAQASATLALAVQFLKASDLLPAPELDYDVGGVLDLNNFTGDTSLRVRPWPFIRAGQRYWLEGQGILKGGGSYEHLFRTNVTVSAGEETTGLELAVQRTELEKLELSTDFRLTLKVNFQSVSNESETQSFPVRSVRVEEPAVGQLPAPSVNGAINGVLNPITVVSNATVIAAYPSMSPSDQITLRWAGTSGAGSTTIGPKFGNALGIVEFEVPAAVAGANIGKPVVLSYTRTRAGTTLTSGELSLQVQYLQSADLQPPPELQHDNAGVLDLNSFAGDTTLTITPWPFIKAGQRYWLQGRGTLKGGGDYEHLFRTNVTVLAAEETAGLVLTVQRTELEKLELGADFRLTFKVNFQGLNNEDEAQGFPVRQVTVAATSSRLGKPSVLRATGANGDQLDFSDVYTENYVTVTVPQYSGMAAGHTVRVRWQGPRFTYNTEIVPVVTPGVMSFRVPRMEVIDAIGSTVPVTYSVIRAAGQPVETSDPLDLNIREQPIQLLAPTYAPATRTVTVNYPGPATGHTVRVRWEGTSVRDTATHNVVAGQPITFIITPLWVSENTGRRVLINYSISRQQTGELLLFSQVLRVDL